MIIIISPAKNINEDISFDAKQLSNTRFENQTNELLSRAKKLSVKDLMSMMKISENLGQLNYQRYQQMEVPFSNFKLLPALKAFNGAVFQSINVGGFTDEDWKFANDKLRILSGFYGLLRPFDGILPYRLEMGTKLDIGKHKNLYQFWDMKINNLLQNDIDTNGDNVLINLASNEYFKAVKGKELNARIITPTFKEYKDGKYKMIAIYAKMARGMMSNFIIKNKLSNPEEIKLFDTEGYSYNDQLSEGDNWVFTR
ncbi:MAG: peroxide stress protein YaaA [Bacteroidetes bacterium 4572_112]|nr:MAG: peroxide stress protein YaaA [Bacteroidetes bacterium 4572_112]